MDETFKSVINTYSRATLNNTRRIVIQNEPEAVVMRYIKVAEIQRIFDGRKTKILDFAQEAIRAEKKAQVADALRYYYWALVLLQSYPDGNFLTMKDEEGKDLLLTTWIPKQMNDIFSNLKVSMESTHLDGDLKTINLKVLYKGQPATTITRISTVATGPISSQPKTAQASWNFPYLPTPVICNSAPSICLKVKQISTTNCPK